VRSATWLCRHTLSCFPWCVGSLTQSMTSLWGDLTQDPGVWWRVELTIISGIIWSDMICYVYYITLWDVNVLFNIRLSGKGMNKLISNLPENIDIQNIKRLTGFWMHMWRKECNLFKLLQVNNVRPAQTIIFNIKVYLHQLFQINSILQNVQTVLIVLSYILYIKELGCLYTTSEPEVLVQIRAIDNRYLYSLWLSQIRSSKQRTLIWTCMIE
jgi:hypothetical protein